MTITATSPRLKARYRTAVRNDGNGEQTLALRLSLLLDRLGLGRAASAGATPYSPARRARCAMRRTPRFL